MKNTAKGTATRPPTPRAETVPPAPTRDVAAARMQGPTFWDRLTPEERRRGLPDVPEVAGGRGPAPDDA